MTRMRAEEDQQRAAKIGGALSALISLSVAIAFFSAASALGKYTAVAIYGGAAWVFVLSMIVTMPTVMPWVKKRREV